MPIAKIRADRIKETSYFTGTNDILLLGSGTGFREFGSVCTTGDIFDYAVTHEGTTDWETGVGTYNSSTNVVARTTVVASSNNNEKVDFGTGYKHVFITVNGDTFTKLDRAPSTVQATWLAVALGS
jgi:hypothetical protein